MYQTANITEGKMKTSEGLMTDVPKINNKISQKEKISNSYLPTSVNI
jgi:hypothetical protein